MTPEHLLNLYRRLPPRLRDAIPLGTALWLRDSALPRLTGASLAQPLETRLWAGFSRDALPALETLARSPDDREAATAALALARWHGAHGDFDAALAHIRLMRDRHPAARRDRRQGMLEALFLGRLGRGAEARARLDGPGTGRRSDSSHILLRASSWTATEPDRALAELNRLYRRHGLAELARRDPAAPLSLDNLRGLAAPRPGGPLVTIIVPLWNAAATLRTSLLSLAEQSHENLEILVVDDASTDAGPDIAADIARADPRFRLIRQAENAGPYIARNRALTEARGVFVTVQDADDWSHPDRVATHLSKPDAAFTFSDWVRVGDALDIRGPWRPSPTLTSRNYASLLIRRALIERIGPWDQARFAADREFADRARHILGRETALLTGCPLAFGRDSGASLTRTAATHAATLHHGIRRDYHEAATLWHRTLRPLPGPGLFPAPLAIRPRPANPRHDLLLIGDFNFQGGTQKSALNMLAASRAASLSTALLHYRRYDQDVTAPLNPDVRRFAWDKDIRVVAPGERVTARTVVLSYPPILDHVMDRFPEITHDHLFVVVNQLAERDRAGTDIAYDPARVRANLVELLGSEGRWVPISPRVRAVMEADPRYPAPAPETWTPLLDTALWCARPPLWRGATRARPRLGRHGRDHPLKWPESRADLRAAYCADRPIDVRFLGGAARARARVGRWPANWQALPFGAEDPRDFLAGLDFFVHYPSPDYIEEFGRAPMEAMAAGIPVILPPDFEPTFGAAALYASPGDVWPLIETLWRDRAAWEARAAQGRAFVQTRCAYETFPARLPR